MIIQRKPARGFFFARRYKSVFALLLIFFSFINQNILAQTVSLSVKQALQRVQSALPQLEALRQQTAAAQQNIQLVKNGLVPDLNAGYQVNMATFNNITGMSYPGFLLPVSGPPSVSNGLNFVPGTAAGALLKWNPVTFGQRRAAAEKAAAQFTQANTTYNEQVFQYLYSTINVYLEAVYCKQLMKTEAAAVLRSTVGLDQSLVLAKNGLRPGIDTAEFQSAIAQAEIDFLQAERIYQQKIAELGRLTVMDSTAGILLTDTIFSAAPGILTDAGFSINDHPLLQKFEAQKNSTAASLKEIQKSGAPRLDLWGNLYARGSGVDAAGHINKADGLNLSRTNAGFGVQLSFAVLQYGKINIQKKQYQFLLKADQATLLQAQLDIRTQTAAALQQYRQDVKIAGKSPVLLKSAKNVYDGLQLSYATGLIDYTRLAQAQYDLLKAEVSDANAQLQLWRSLLAVAVAKGNLNLFTDQLK